MLHRPRSRALVAALAALTFTLTACGGDADPAATSAPDAAQTAANGDVFTDADVSFATEMIPHHAQALQMVDLTVGRDLDPAVATLAEDIRAAQGPEIEQLVDWLTAWDEPIPETARDHANADGGMDDMDDMDDMDMPGMMSGAELDDLAALEGREFEQRWLEMMVEHHNGAIEMAQAEQADGRFAPAVELAGSIADGQDAQVTEMEALLGS